MEESEPQATIHHGDPTIETTNTSPPTGVHLSGFLLFVPFGTKDRSLIALGSQKSSSIAFSPHLLPFSDRHVLPRLDPR
jgi:hypothetical protein